MNLLRPGDCSVPGRRIDDTTDFDTVLEQALLEGDYPARRVRHAALNATQASADGPLRRGVGLLTFRHGAGFTGNGEGVLASEAVVRATRDGCVETVAATQCGICQ